ncbi:MAG: arylsulfatase A-like enzyme [Myxococcota bacterium]
MGLALSCSGSETSPTDKPQAAEKPDIVLVVVDTLRADHLGVYGHTRPTSPNIDQLASEGLWFSRAYAQSGWTLASFSSLLTGLLPHQHCVGRDMKDATRFGSLPEEITTLAEALSAEGYATAAVMNNTFLAPAFNLDQGFGDDYLWQGAHNDSHRTAAETVALGTAWLDKQDRPAFLLLHMMEPHLDYSAPTPQRGTFLPDPPFPMPLADPRVLLQAGTHALTPEFVDAVKAVYDEEILAADAAVGTLRATLAVRDRPTWTILTADHGEEFWDHGGFEHGHSLYSELTRVPLIVSGPELKTRGEVTGVVQHLDLFQMLLHLGGATPPPQTGGTDLLALARDGIPADRAVVNDNVLYGPPQISLVTRQHRLIIDQHTGTGAVWAIDAQGTESVRLQGKLQIDRARSMMPLLEELRGDMKPCTPHNETRIPDFETFDQLRSLGYIE